MLGATPGMHLAAAPHSARPALSKRREILTLTASIALTVLIVQTASFSCTRDTAELRSESAPRATRPVVKPRAFRAITGRTSSVAALASAGGIADIVEATLPSVANISSTRVMRGEQRGESPMSEDPLFRRFFRDLPFDLPGRTPERKELSLGSAVIVSEDGVMLTNNHVVEHADEVRVALWDGRELTADIVGTDPLSDLAVLKIKGEPKDLRPITFGDSTSLRLGDFVIAIGNPFGVGQTVTMGIVSAKGRADLGIVDYEDFIQTDAAINPGNSGGALVALDGRLAGINTAILSRTGGYQGIGFAIPVEMALPIMEALLRDGKVVRGWLGIGIQDLNPALAQALELESTQGVLVSEVSPKSPAARAGLKPRDVILAVDGETVTSAGKLRNEIARRGAGAKVDLRLLRDGKETTIPATLGELPARAGSIERLRKDRDRGESENEQDSEAVGLLVAPLSPSVRSQYNVPPELEHGVVVTDVMEGSLADQAGILPGDVILEVDRSETSSTRDLANQLARAGGRILMRVFRESSAFYVVIDRERAP
jgi:serine protease Do